MATLMLSILLEYYIIREILYLKTWGKQYFGILRHLSKAMMEPSLIWL